MTMVRMVFALLSTLVLTACGGQTGLNNATGCIFEVKPQGSYGISGWGEVRTVVPGADGTQAGADAVNACIRQRSVGLTSEPTLTLGGTNTVEVNGDTTTQTFTYGSPRDRNGNLIQTQANVPAQASPVQASPLDQITSPFNTSQPVNGICNLRMTGGSGYTCEVPFNSRRN